jgi:phosphate transport system substrate-binding protein
MKLNRTLAAVVSVASAVVLAFAPNAQAATTLVVGGASSVASIVGDCKVAYTAATGDSFAYASSSSGQGQKDMENAKDDYAYSDSAHLTSQSGTAIPASEIHIPAWVWPIGIQYHNFGKNTPIAISAANLAKIFAGKIKKWNDPALVADNNRTYTRDIFETDGKGNVVKGANGQPVVIRTVKVKQNLTLPNQPITVIYRADSSGTTGNLLAAFSKIDATDWPTASASASTKVFSSSDAKSVISADPIHFQGANGSAGVAQLAAKTPYSITYAETNFAALNSLDLANVINANGDLVQPDAGAASAQVSTAAIADNGVVTLDYLNKAPGVYPFTVVTYALALTNYGDATKAAAVKNAIQWHAFNCPKTAPNDGFIQIDPASTLGKKVAAQIAKLGK